MRGNQARVEGAQVGVKKPEPTEHMPIFDMLPPPVRQAISEADFDFDTVTVARWMRAGLSAEDTARMLREENARVVEHQMRMKGLK